MRRIAPWILLAAGAAVVVPAAEADLLFFRRDDRQRRSDDRRAAPIRLVQGSRLEPEALPRAEDRYFYIPPAPLDESGQPVVPGELPPLPGELPVIGEPLPVIPEQFEAMLKSSRGLFAGPIELFTRVKYDDVDEAPRRGVKRLAVVRDPRICRKACDCCEPRLVFVEVCVPAHGCPKVKCSRDGRKVELEYGELEIEIESEDGKVEVEYDD